MPAPTREFWQGRRVLVTGHTGFKGTWLTVWLLNLGATVIGYSDAVPTERSLFEDTNVAPLIEDVRGDIRDEAHFAEVVGNTNPDVILHLAAQPLVRYSYTQPVETFATNVMGTVNVLEAARRHRLGLPVLIVTTDKCYENREWIWAYRENEAMGGHDPYSASKGCAELVTSAYARSFMAEGSKLRIVSARAGNVIGGGDWALDRLVPDLVRGLMAGESVGIRNPAAVRPWQHVLEPLCGYLLLTQRMMEGADVTGQGWNFGPDLDSEVPVGAVADTICRLWSAKEGWHFSGVPGQHHEAMTLRLDSSKARRLLDWRSRWSLPKALEASVAVYRSAARGSELRDILGSQIDSYVASHGAPETCSE